MKKNIYSILIIDDAFFLRNIIKKAIANKPKDDELHYDFEIATEAQNGEEGLELYKIIKPDIVTVDINMPKLNGLDFVKKLKSIYPYAKVIVISSSLKSEYEHKALDAGAYTYIQKPFQDSYLWSRLDEIAKTIEEERKNFNISQFSTINNVQKVSIGNVNKNEVQIESKDKEINEPHKVKEINKSHNDNKNKVTQKTIEEKKVIKEQHHKSVKEMPKEKIEKAVDVNDILSGMITNDDSEHLRPKKKKNKKKHVNGNDRRGSVDGLDGLVAVSKPTNTPKKVVADLNDLDDLELPIISKPKQKSKHKKAKVQEQKSTKQIIEKMEPKEDLHAINEDIEEVKVEKEIPLIVNEIKDDVVCDKVANENKLNSNEIVEDTKKEVIIEDNDDISNDEKLPLELGNEDIVIDNEDIIIEDDEELPLEIDSDDITIEDEDIIIEDNEEIPLEIDNDNIVIEDDEELSLEIDNDNIVIDSDDIIIEDDKEIDNELYSEEIDDNTQDYVNKVIAEGLDADISNPDYLENNITYDLHKYARPLSVIRQQEASNAEIEENIESQPIQKENDQSDEFSARSPFSDGTMDYFMIDESPKEEDIHNADHSAGVVHENTYKNIQNTLSYNQDNNNINKATITPPKNIKMKELYVDKMERNYNVVFEDIKNNEEPSVEKKKTGFFGKILGLFNRKKKS